MPLMRRALKMRTDREVTPQLGLLKSTLLQLDSTFSERTYGVSSFRDFAEKLASAGFVTLRESGRNILVELKEDGHHPRQVESRPIQEPRNAQADHRGAPAVPQEDAPVNGGGPAQTSEPPRTEEAVREVRRLFQSAQNPPRWPMYVRQVKQFLRGVDPGFDERRFGFSSLNDLLRACQRDGLFRVERDRQGVVRFFQGNALKGTEIHGMLQSLAEANGMRILTWWWAPGALCDQHDVVAKPARVPHEVVDRKRRPVIRSSGQARARKAAPRATAAPKAAKTAKAPKAREKEGRQAARARKKADVAADA
jgi:hypothetical protein